MLRQTVTNAPQGVFRMAGSVFGKHVVSFSERTGYGLPGNLFQQALCFGIEHFPRLFFFFPGHTPLPFRPECRRPYTPLPGRYRRRHLRNPRHAVLSIGLRPSFRAADITDAIGPPPQASHSPFDRSFRRPSGSNADTRFATRPSRRCATFPAMIMRKIRTCHQQDRFVPGTSGQHVSETTAGGRILAAHYKGRQLESGHRGLYERQLNFNGMFLGYVPRQRTEWTCPPFSAHL